MAPLKPVRATALAAIPVGIGIAVAVSATGTVNQARPLVSARPAVPHPATSRPAAAHPAVVIASPVVRAVNGGGTGLFRFSPVQVFNVSRLRTAPVVIDGTSYMDSILFTCAAGGHVSSGDIDYPVSGYGSLATTIAALGGTASVSLFNNGAGSQVAGPYHVSPGHPRTVHVRFPGASQLEISCTPSGPRSPSVVLALANPVLSSH